MNGNISKKKGLASDITQAHLDYISGKVSASMGEKQDKLIFDDEPTKGSKNSVTSGTVAVSLEKKADRTEIPKKVSELEDSEQYCKAEALETVSKEADKNKTDIEALEKTVGELDRVYATKEDLRTKEDVSSKVTGIIPGTSYGEDVYPTVDAVTNYIERQTEDFEEKTYKTSTSRYGDDGTQFMPEYYDRAYYSLNGTHRYVKDYVDDASEKIKDSLGTIFRYKGSIHSPTHSLMTKPTVGDVVNCAFDMDIPGSQEFTAENNSAQVSCTPYNAINYKRTPTNLIIYPGATLVITDASDSSKSMSCTVAEFNFAENFDRFNIFVEEDLSATFENSTNVILSNLSNNKLSVKAGDNIVYTQFGWDNLHSSIDLSTYATKTEIADKEDIANKVTSIATGADDVKYPTAKAVKDYTDSSRKYDVIIDYTYNEDETTAKLRIPVTEEQYNKIKRYEKFFSRVSYQVPADPNGSTDFWAYTALAVCNKSAPTIPVGYVAMFMRASNKPDKRNEDGLNWVWMASAEKVILPAAGGDIYVSNILDGGGTIYEFLNVSSYTKLSQSRLQSNQLNSAYSDYAWVIEISVPAAMPISKGMRFTLWGK